MKVRYKKRDRWLQEGTVVYIDNCHTFSPVQKPLWIPAQVMEILNVQFTAQLMDGTHTLCYRFYNDVGQTWKFDDED